MYHPALFGEAKGFSSHEDNDNWWLSQENNLHEKLFWKEIRKEVTSGNWKCENLNEYEPS